MTDDAREREILSKIGDFFVAPSVDPASLPRTKSVLYLLRRDVNFCFGIDPLTGTRDPRRGRASFPGVMTIMAGWDLLAKFLVGQDVGQAGARMQTFIRRYVHSDSGNLLNDVQAWSLWQLRNTMLHSFSLNAKVTEANPRTDVVRFVLAEEALDVIVVGQSGSNPREWIAVIDVWKLQARFEQSVSAYRQDLQAPEGRDLRARFERMWPDYARMVVQT